MKLYAGKVGTRKYSMSARKVVIRVVGPMMIECRRRFGENDTGRSRRNVIIEVGRSKTARDASIRDREILLQVRIWQEKELVQGRIGGWDM